MVIITMILIIKFLLNWPQLFRGCIMPFFTLEFLPEEAKKIEIFPKFQRWMEKTNIFKCKPLEVHFTTRNRVPYNKQLTNQACSGRTGEYWPSVVAVRTSLCSVRTATTSGQYSPVQPSRLVSKRLLKSLKIIA